MNRIGMVVAMQKEILPFLDRYGTPIRAEKDGNYLIYSYRYSGKDIFVIQSGIGEISAAAAAQHLITKYGVECLINFGVCGGLTDDMSVCKTVLVKSVVHYDFDLSPIDRIEKCRYPQFESVYIPTDSELNRLILEVAPEIEQVVCASADKFVADIEVKNFLNSEYLAEVCEMEAAGVLLTALSNKIPCAVIKAVSDGKAGDADEFHKMVAKASKAYIDIVTNLIEKL